MKILLPAAEKPKWKGRAFPLRGIFSDGRLKQDEKVVDPRDDASVLIDFRLLPPDDRSESTWRERTKESGFLYRMVWVCGDTTAIEQKVRDLARCRGMVSKYSKIRESLSTAKKLLLKSEEIREEELETEVRDAVAASWKSGKFYYDGDRYEAKKHGSFGTAVTRTATTILPALFPHFDATTIVPSELAQLLEPELSGPSIKFMEDHLGILELDSGRYVPACSGVVPRRIQEHIENGGHRPLLKGS